jgi:uncharacterized membrane protein
MKPQHPVVERYMTHLETAIGGLDPAERHEVVQEIRNHIAEAIAAGKPIDLVLKSLGPADAFGRAYAIELLLHPQSDRRRSAAQRWFSIVGLIVVLSIPTLVAVSTLGSIGVSFVAAGVASVVIGVLEATGVLPWGHVSDLPPGVAILAGPVLVVVGLLSLMALRLYVRFAARAVRTTLPSVRSPERVQRTAARSAV